MQLSFCEIKKDLLHFKFVHFFIYHFLFWFYYVIGLESNTKNSPRKVSLPILWAADYH